VPRQAASKDRVHQADRLRPSALVHVSVQDYGPGVNTQRVFYSAGAARTWALGEQAKIIALDESNYVDASQALSKYLLAASASTMGRPVGPIGYGWVNCG